MEYTFKVNRMSATDTTEFQKAVVVVDWVKIGTDENGLTGEYYGINQFDITSISPESFTPYEDLTEEIVIGWIKDKIFDDSYVNRMIDDQIKKKKNPQYNVNLPWLPTPEPAPLPPTE